MLKLKINVLVQEYNGNYLFYIKKYIKKYIFFKKIHF
jgi:hypothetical protein